MITLNNNFTFVSVITVNYNGKRYLQSFFSALAELVYPKNKFEVIFVDNASTDGSVNYVKDNFPWVKIIQNDRNLGFAEGNNVAIRKASADYIALLNNDTVVDKKWLLELVKVAQSNASIGATTSKMLFCSKFITLIIKSSIFNPLKEGISADGRDLGVAVESVNINNFKPRFNDKVYRIEYLQGFYGPEKSIDNNFRWTSGIAEIRLPVYEMNRALLVNLKIGAFRPEKFQDPEITFLVDEIEIKKIRLPRDKFIDIQLNIPENIIESSGYDLINNAGSIIYENGNGADRGFYERDRGQYDKAEEVFSACGASVLYKKEMLEDVGLFDEDFFMYYEDTDLAWRARLKGWKIYYCPDSIVYHVHCGSSIEWSPFFIFHTDKNRIFMLMKNANLNLAAITLLKYIGSVVLIVLSWVYKLFKKHNNQDAAKVKLKIFVILIIFKNIPLMLRKRSKIQRSRTISDEEIQNWMIKK